MESAAYLNLYLPTPANKFTHGAVAPSLDEIPGPSAFGEGNIGSDGVLLRDGQVSTWLWR